MSRHWHAMNGNIGCIPDNNQVCSNKSSAIASLCNLFDHPLGMQAELKRSNIYYFPVPAEAGADYAKVSLCFDDDCEDSE